MRDQTIGKLNSVGEDDEMEAEVVKAEKGSITKAEKKHMSGSQFADAEEERVRAHIEVALVKGADHIVSISFWLPGSKLMSVTHYTHNSSRWRNTAQTHRSKRTTDR